MIMNQQIQTQATELKKSIFDDINKYEKTSQENRSVIQNQLRRQHDNISSKLMKRREKSINKSMERSFSKIRNKSAMIFQDKQKKDNIKNEFRKFENQLKESIMTESILGQLDEDDSKT